MEDSFRCTETTIGQTKPWHLLRRDHHSKSMEARQLSDSIAGPLPDRGTDRAVWQFSGASLRRAANRDEAAIVTARQFLSVDTGGQSVNSDSSSQSSAEARACSEPNNSVTAPMKAESSRSAMCVCCS